eukprot:3689120-Rhodomonas_salina.1
MCNCCKDELDHLCDFKCWCLAEIKAMVERAQRTGDYPNSTQKKGTRPIFGRDGTTIINQA